MNLGICTKCGKIVPTGHLERNGKEYLEKDCPDCGKTNELVSNDSAKYRVKRAFMADKSYPGCTMNCLDCTHKLPNIIFIETTNRCNMNCPICITNVPSMGFEFEPRMEFFERIFKYYSQFEFPPSVQLFGGEPTMREDVFEIIKLARSYGLSVRLVTNGLKLADQAYCDRVMASGASVLISFDGLRREMYEKLRAFPGSLDLKYKALENIYRHKKGKVVLMTVMDKNMNGADMPEFLNYCMKSDGVIRGIFLMPLSHVWTEERFDYQPDRTTQEDVENIVDKAVGGGAEFVPLGSLEIRNIAKVFDLKHMPFLGVHPNCESFTLLVSDGKKYNPLSKYLKYGFWGFARDIRTFDARIEKDAMKPVKGLKKAAIAMAFAGIFLKHLSLGAVFGTKGPGTAARILKIAAMVIGGKKFKEVFKKESAVKGILQIILLPFEDNCTLESERLEKCASCFAYIDVKTDEVKSIPFCIWEKYKQVIMKEIAQKYNKEGYFKGLETA
jgi:uncharacterized radical SAM superfamily Fe-S cluster-containing enzyme